MEKHWDEKIETIPREKLMQLQGERLQRQILYVFENSRFYREKFREAGISPGDIQSVGDLKDLPVTSKDDLRAQRSKTGDVFSDTLCVPQSQLVKMNHSTGTSGIPNIYGLTQNDWDDLCDAFARSQYRIGMRPGDKTNNWLESAMTWHGYFMTANGARHLGATVYTCEPDNRSIVPTTLEMLAGADLDCIFVYHPEIEIEYLRRKNLKPKEIHPNLRFIYSAALTSDSRRKLLEDAWGVPYFNMGGSGDQYVALSECPYSSSALHGMEDRFIFEVLDPITLNPVKPGEVGELVLTNLWAEATPYIRYRMEDMVTVDYELCQCGSTHVRLNFLGRMAWSCDVQGKRIFSDQVENVLWKHIEFAQYQIVKYEEQPQSKLIVRTTTQDESASAKEKIHQRIKEDLEYEFALPCDVEFVSEGDIGVGTVKFDRVFKRPGRG
jgi:phenylacetate-CoA ligase